MKRIAGLVHELVKAGLLVIEIEVIVYLWRLL
jgi:hypothetical protein